jgi:hypothetical protein
MARWVCCHIDRAITTLHADVVCMQGIVYDYEIEYMASSPMITALPADPRTLSKPN